MYIDFSTKSLHVCPYLGQYRISKGLKSPKYRKAPEHEPLEALGREHIREVG